MYILRLIHIFSILFFGTSAYGGTVDEAQRLLNKSGYNAGIVGSMVQKQSLRWYHFIATSHKNLMDA